MKTYLQISLRTVIFGMTSVACLAGMYYRQLAPFYAEQKAVMALTKIGSVRIEYAPAQVDPLSRWILGPDNCRHVTSLILMGEQFDDHALRHLRAFHHLGTLQLWWLNITTEGLQQIPINPKLEGLAIRFISLPPDYIEELTRFAPNVRRLRIEATGLTDPAVQSLLPHICTTHLSIEKESITDACLPAIAAQRELEMLDLTETDVTDAVVSIAKSMPHLTYLCVTGTQLTHAGYDQLLALGHTRQGFHFDPVVFRR